MFSFTLRNETNQANRNQRRASINFVPTFDTKVFSSDCEGEVAAKQ